MTGGISHTFISAKADGADATLIQPSNWNAAHTFNDLNFTQNNIINGDFRVNQRGYVSAAALAAGAYGHDRWKAGASGGDYSFTQLASATQITIAANKSLIQVVEDKNVVGGTYTLSWTGTAVGRLKINSATPTGNFAVSPITVAAQTAGTVMSLELTGANAVGGSSLGTNTGTVGVVKLEVGSVATPFVPDDYSVSLRKCLRYGRPLCGSVTGFANGTTIVDAGLDLSSNPMRSTPTLIAGTQLAVAEGSSGNPAQSSPGITFANYYTQFGGVLRFSSFAGLTNGNVYVIGPNLLTGNATTYYAFLDSEL